MYRSRRTKNGVNINPFSYVYITYVHMKKFIPVKFTYYKYICYYMNLYRLHTGTADVIYVLAHARL